jgi:hypothetical protein
MIAFATPDIRDVHSKRAETSNEIKQMDRVDVRKTPFRSPHLIYKISYIPNRGVMILILELKWN